MKELESYIGGFLRKNGNNLAGRSKEGIIRCFIKHVNFERENSRRTGIEIAKALGKQVSRGEPLSCPLCSDPPPSPPEGKQPMASVGDAEDHLFCPHCELYVELKVTYNPDEDTRTAEERIAQIKESSLVYEDNSQQKQSPAQT